MSEPAWQRASKSCMNASSRLRSRPISSTVLRDPHRCLILINDFTVESDVGDVQLPTIPPPQFLEVQDKLKPLTVTVPHPFELLPQFLKLRARGVQTKERRGAPAIAQHDRIAAEPNTLCVYTDGSTRADNLGGAGATIPALSQAALRHLGRLNQPRKTTVAELSALALGLELAARYAQQGWKIALFTDSQFEKNFSASEWADASVMRLFIRAEKALKDLDRRGCQVRAYWIPGHRGLVEGMITAHRIASEASRLTAESLSRLLLMPVNTAGVALDHVGVVTTDRPYLCIAPCPRRLRPGGLPLDGLSSVDAYTGMRELFSSEGPTASASTC